MRGKERRKGRGEGGKEEEWREGKRKEKRKCEGKGGERKGRKERL